MPRPGDLVFFHDPGGYTYHTGIYEGGGSMVSALNYAYGVKPDTGQVGRHVRDLRQYHALIAAKAAVAPARLVQALVK